MDTSPRCFSPRRCLWLLLVLLAVTAHSGCVRRRMTVRSNPPGAVVFVDERRLGVTPVSTSFTYYGTRDVRLMKDGYETVTRGTQVLDPLVSVPGHRLLCGERVAL